MAIQAQSSRATDGSIRVFQALEHARQRFAESASVTVHPSRGRIFHDVEIEGVRFQCLVSEDGPVVGRVCTRDRFHQGQVHLGVSVLYRLAQRSRYDPPGTGAPTWWACKYGPNEPRINLDGLSEAGVLAFSHEFGIALDRGDDPSHLLFYVSPAFDALCRWAQAHPRMIRRYRPSPYLRNWPGSAIAGEWVG